MEHALRQRSTKRWRLKSKQKQHIQCKSGGAQRSLVAAGCHQSSSLWFSCRMQDLIMSGPSNISMHRSTHNEFVIRWTPMADDLGEHYPICFAVESATGSDISSFQTASYNHVHATAVSQSGVYQTEMRCVLVDVGKEQIKANVVCGESSMRVEIPKDSLTGLSEDHLELSDPTNTVCSLTTHSNSSHVIADFPLNACGTQIEEDDDNLFFKNEITTVDDPSQLITRKHLMEISFYCQYAKKSNMTVGFTAHRKNITVWERGFGTFTYQFEFYPDNQYQAMIDPNSYPLEYELGNKIYMEIEASSLNNTEMFVESCRASPYDNPNYHSTYTIIDNGCTVDPTVQIYAPSNQKQFRFSVEAFKFIGLHDQVYISCSVMVCEAGNPNTRCSQGCMNSSSSNDHHHIHKREAGVQSGAHFISQGPLRLHSDNSASGMYGSPEEVSKSVCEPDWVSSACLVSRDEPEPGLHRRMSSGCCGNDLWRGRLQDQNGPSPTSTSVPPLKAVRDLFS
uniref:ZP domain-containing protein n=1 Tax=Oryzias latipes TaxID=8090 RepID=A0A3P9KAY5_ORYLA